MMVSPGDALVWGRSISPAQRRDLAASPCSWRIVSESPSVFLAVIAADYAILAGVRNRPGVTPTRRLKCWVNWLWSVNPAFVATSASDRSSRLCRSCFARSTRRSDDVLVRRQPGGRFELPGEVEGTEPGDRGHLLQGWSGVEVSVDVVDDGAELRSWQCAVPPALRAAWGQDMPDQGGRPEDWPAIRQRAFPRRRRTSARR